MNAGDVAGGVATEKDSCSKVSPVFLKFILTYYKATNIMQINKPYYLSNTVP